MAALPYRHVAPVPGYWAEIPGDKALRGRVRLPRDAGPTMSDGGLVAIRTMSAAAQRDGVGIRTDHGATPAVLGPGGAVTGVKATTTSVAPFRARAKKPVVFATAGCTDRAELSRNS